MKDIICNINKIKYEIKKEERFLEVRKKYIKDELEKKLKNNPVLGSMGMLKLKNLHDSLLKNNYNNICNIKRLKNKLFFLERKLLCQKQKFKVTKEV